MVTTVDAVSGHSYHQNSGIALTFLAYLAAIAVAFVALGLNRGSLWSRTPALFTQLFIGTTGDKAMLGSITSGPTHYTPWRDPYPLTEDELAQRLHKPRTALTQQEILTEAILHPARLRWRRLRLAFL